MKERMVLEIRAGEGGKDSKLFIKDMVKMYSKYSEPPSSFFVSPTSNNESPELIFCKFGFFCDNPRTPISGVGFIGPFGV